MNDYYDAQLDAGDLDGLGAALDGDGRDGDDAGDGFGADYGEYAGDLLDSFAADALDEYAGDLLDRAGYRGVSRSSGNLVRTASPPRASSRAR